MAEMVSIIDEEKAVKIAAKLCSFYDRMEKTEKSNLIDAIMMRGEHGEKTNKLVLELSAKYLGANALGDEQLVRMGFSLEEEDHEEKLLK